jgi:signal transduction histidine kinase
MNLSKQPSFRRIMLLRILLVSIPILLVGIAVTFRKTRTSLLFSARQNLTESAENKALTLQSSIHALQLGLVAASESVALRTGDANAARVFLQELAEQLPSEAHCLSLLDLNAEKTSTYSMVDTCEQFTPNDLSTDELILQWPQNREVLDSNRFYVHALDVNLTQPEGDRVGSTLDVMIQTPVYGEDNQLRSLLKAQVQLAPVDSAEPGSLLGYTMIIREDGTILSHPFPNQVGKTIYTQDNGEQLSQILRSALSNKQDAQNLFTFAGDNREWLAGYDSISIEVSPVNDETWVVLAVTPVDNALHGLQDIRRILLVLSGVLTTAHLLAMLYTARDLARPIERLGRYAQQIEENTTTQIPRNFQIREIDQLATVLESMVGRLEDRATELQSAWQEAQTANQLKNEFLANTSHELRTPLNAIIGCIRLIKDDFCDSRDEELDFLNKADEAAIHLLKIINDLLDIAKIEAGTLSMVLEHTDLGQILQDVLNLQAVAANQKGLWITIPEVPEGIVVNVDAAKLKQVFLNIIYNAIKFTDEGGIAIHLRVEYLRHGDKPSVHQAAALTEETSSTDSRSNHSDSSPAALTELNSALTPWIIVSVTDTGIGIDPTQQDKLFKPFVMVDGSTTRKFEGTGLGLAISRNLVEMLNGSITLYSAGTGHGTTVEIALPVVELPPGYLSVNGDRPSSTSSEASPSMPLNRGDSSLKSETLA